MRGSNQFMKSFVQNSKNSSMFNHFLGRCNNRFQNNQTQKKSMEAASSVEGRSAAGRGMANMTNKEQQQKLSVILENATKAACKDD